MRRTVVRKGTKMGQALPDETESKRQRNCDADVVGKAKANEIDYDDVGSEEVTGGSTLKIETSPQGQEIYEGDVEVGDTVYWGIKRA